MGRLFGTDGVRGVANRELTPHLAYCIGRAFAAHLLEVGYPHPRVLIGRDTRISGPMLEGALIAGVASTGVDVCLAGVIPTPGVALVVRQSEMCAGIMISASHNPVDDNGIKLFGSDGFKLNDAAEDAIEETVQKLLQGEDTLPAPIGGAVGRVLPYDEAPQAYADALISAVPLDLSGVKVVLDCAQGAAVPVAGTLFRRLGATVTELNVEPDGLNINVHCGSTHPGVVAEAVVRHKADIGFAFDGDADRVIAVDEDGQIHDGDRILALCALHLLDRNLLPERTIAATTYSNLALIEAIEAAGGHVITTKAGDRYVLEALREYGLTLGGEQSGHVIFLDHNTTGDGLLTALKVLQVLSEQGSSLAALRDRLQPYPQHLVNVRVASKEWESNVRLAAAVEQAERALGANGRIFVRASGTEPLIRVLGEGKDDAAVRRIVDDVAAVIAEELGG